MALQRAGHKRRATSYVVDQPQLCDAITPSDRCRDPGGCAIVLEGTAPVLARPKSRQKLEEMLEPGLR